MENEDAKSIIFGKLKESHLEMMMNWLNIDFVKEWYGKRDWSYQDVVDKGILIAI